MSSESDDDQIYKALGHFRRRQLLDLIRDNPQTTGSLCEAVPELDRCTVMQHLRVLEEAGLVVPLRKGRERFNHLDAMPIQAIHERWIGAYAAFAVEKLAELKAGLEG